MVLTVFQRLLQRGEEAQGRWTAEFQDQSNQGCVGEEGKRWGRVLLCQIIKCLKATALNKAPHILFLTAEMLIRIEKKTVLVTFLARTWGAEI